MHEDNLISNAQRKPKRQHMKYEGLSKSFAIHYDIIKER